MYHSITIMSPSNILLHGVDNMAEQIKTIDIESVLERSSGGIQNKEQHQLIAHPVENVRESPQSSKVGV